MDIAIHLTRTIQEFLPINFVQKAKTKINKLIKNYLLLKHVTHDCSFIIMNKYIELYIDNAIQDVIWMITPTFDYTRPLFLGEDDDHIVDGMLYLLYDKEIC